MDFVAQSVALHYWTHVNCQKKLLPTERSILKLYVSSEALWCFLGAIDGNRMPNTSEEARAVLEVVVAIQHYDDYKLFTPTENVDVKFRPICEMTMRTIGLTWDGTFNQVLVESIKGCYAPL